MWITYYYFKEALKYQSPKYVVLETHMAVAGNNDFAEEQVNRDAIDKMRFSINKINAINTSVKDKKDRISYYFNIIKYHTRYKELTTLDFKTVFLNYSIDNRGYIALPNTEYKFKNTYNYADKVLKISDKNEKYLKKIINLAKSEKIDIILVKSPAKYTENEIAKLNYIYEIANKSNIPFFNYIENLDTLNLDYNNDFHDAGHLSKTGSIKFTTKFCEDLKKYKLTE